MAVELGTAYLSVLPTTTGLVPGIDKGLAGLPAIAGRHGHAMGSQMGGGAQRGLKGSMPAIGSMLKTALVGVGISGGIALIGAIGTGIGRASDANETINKAQAIYGDSFAAMDKWASSATTSLGMSTAAALDAASGFGDMFLQIGFADDQATAMSKSVVQMSTDLGSFNNLQTEDVTQRIAAAFRGEYDALQAVIPNINAARVESEALAATGKKTAKELTAQEKATAVLAIIQKDGARAAGDFAKTSGGLANQQKIAAAQWEEISTTIGTIFLPAITTAMGFVTGTMLPGFEGVVDVLADHLGPAFGVVGDAMSGVTALFSGDPSAAGFLSLPPDHPILALLGSARDLFTETGDAIRRNALPMMDAVSALIDDHVTPVLTDMGEVISTYVLPVWTNLAGFLKREVGPGVNWLTNTIIVPGLSYIGSAFDLMWAIAKPILTNFYQLIRNYVGPTVSWLWSNAVKPVFGWIGDFIKTVFSGAETVMKGFTRLLKGDITGGLKTFRNGFSAVWSDLKALAAKPINFVIGTVWNDGLRKALNLIPGVNLGSARLISGYAEGGWTGPGSKHQPAGVVHADEWVLTKEQVRRAGGPSGVASWIANTLPGYADGGLVTYQGKRFTAPFAAALQMAEQLAGQIFRITQGGFRPTTSYSGTSHAKDAVDIARPYSTGTLIALRSSGIAAWDRAGKGNWIDHIHGVPLPGYGTAGGSAVWQAQDYLKGGDGLGGRDTGPRVAVTSGSGGIFDIPDMISDAIGKLGELSGPWGNLFATGVKTTLDGLTDWVIDKLGPIGDLIFGGATTGKISGNGKMASQLGGYASGTRSALRGPAWVGENGPEIVNFRGGEQVLDADTSRAVASRGDVHIQHMTLDVSGMRDFQQVIDFIRTIPTSTRQGAIVAA